MSSVLLVSVASSLLFGLGLATNITCEGDSDCTYGDYEYDDILCRGYKSCWDSDLNATEYCACNGLYSCHGSDIYSGDDTVCFGEYGCKYATVTSGGNIWCDGRYGCKFTTLKADNNIYCDGEYACRINTIEDVNYLYVNGAGGAQYSDIYGFYRIYAYGYVALTNAYFNTSGESTVLAVFGGYKTTYGATFICASDSKCYIYCISDSGCEELSIYEYGSVSVTCDSSWQSCPNTTDASSEYFNEDVLLDMLEERREKRYADYETELEYAQLKLAPVSARDYVDEKKNQQKQKLLLLNNNEMINTHMNNNTNTENIHLFIAGMVGFGISALLFALYNYFCTSSSKTINNKNGAGYETVV